MRLPASVLDTVIFIGYRASKEEGYITPIGTAFLFAHENYVYLVTAQHIASGIGEDPFVLRFNRHAGGSHTFNVDPIQHHIKWAVHTDPDVDLAVLPFQYNLEELGLRYKQIGSGSVVREDSVPCDFGIGDPCYAVGLFRLLSGTKENLAVVHSGNMALIAGRERIPVDDWLNPRQGKSRNVQAHLVGLHSLDGLSGSPVFVRPPFIVADIRSPDTDSSAMFHQEKVKLLGVWQGSWRGQELFVVNEAVGDKARPSFGMGVVTPARYLMEILESDEMKAQRREYFAGLNIVTPDSVCVDKKEAAVVATPDNPSHKEDFMSLLSAAAQSNKPAS